MYTNFTLILHSNHINHINGNPCFSGHIKHSASMVSNPFAKGTNTFLFMNFLLICIQSWADRGYYRPNSTHNES